MLERMQHLPAGIDGLTAIGTVSKQDYQQVFEPLVDEARRAGTRIRLLYHLGPEFEGFTPGAAWEDVKLGLGAMRRFEGCAIVTDIDWIRTSTRLIDVLLPCPVRLFHERAHAEAVTWLRDLPAGAGVSHRLLPDLAVIVVEVDAPLRTQDFDALAITADTWLETHRVLQGLVIHAREFPGWDNVGSFLRHLRFVRDHHRAVERVALAVDGTFADIVPPLAAHFVQAEIKSFGYDERDGAIAWAAGPAASRRDASTPAPSSVSS